MACHAARGPDRIGGCSPADLASPPPPALLPLGCCGVARSGLSVGPGERWGAGAGASGVPRTVIGLSAKRRDREDKGKLWLCRGPQIVPRALLGVFARPRAGNGQNLLGDGLGPQGLWPCWGTSTLTRIQGFWQLLPGC